MTQPRAVREPLGFCLYPGSSSWCTLPACSLLAGERPVKSAVESAAAVGDDMWAAVAGFTSAQGAPPFWRLVFALYFAFSRAANSRN